MQAKAKVRCPLCDEELGVMTIEVTTTIVHTTGHAHAFVCSDALGHYGIEHDCPAVAR